MTLGRVTPFRFCSVAVIATMFRGLAGDRRGLSHQELHRGQNVGSQLFQLLTREAGQVGQARIESPELGKVVGDRQNKKGGSGSTETPEFSVEAGK